MYRPYDGKRQPGEAYSILTSRHHEELPLQKAGHCDLVETQDGEWYAVHLCGRASEDRNPEDGCGALCGGKEIYAWPGDCHTEDAVDGGRMAGSGRGRKYPEGDGGCSEMCGKAV